MHALHAKRGTDRAWAVRVGGLLNHDRRGFRQRRVFFFFFCFLLFVTAQRRTSSWAAAGSTVAGKGGRERAVETAERNWRNGNG